MDKLEKKKKKFALYGLLHALAEDLDLNERQVERFVENIDADPNDLHDVMYKLAENGLIDEAILTSFLDAADIVAD